MEQLALPPLPSVGKHARAEPPSRKSRKLRKKPASRKLGDVDEGEDRDTQAADDEDVAGDKEEEEKVAGDKDEEGTTDDESPKIVMKKPAAKAKAKGSLTWT